MKQNKKTGEMNIHDIKLNPDNPRLIKDNKFRKLVKSIKDFPKMMELRPIVVDRDMVILGGNMRFRAIQEAGYTDIPEGWVKIADTLSEEEKRRFIIEDNMPFGEWDWDALANQFNVDELLEWGFDEKDLKIEQEVTEDEVPEVSTDPAVSQLGEVYQLGRHRLMCGDATKIEDVEKLMDGQKADMVFTDPPYGVKYEGRKHFDVIENDELDKTGLFDFLDVSFANLSTILKNGGCFYICSGWPTIKEFIEATENKNLNLSTKLVWIKNNLGWGFADYRTKTEVILYGFKEGDKHYWCGDRDQSDLWEFNKDTEYKHPTQKPIALCSKAINNSSKDNDLVLDLFLGSGSTLIACEQTNRICYGMEIDPKYCDVIRKRYAKFIGKEDEWIQTTPNLH